MTHAQGRNMKRYFSPAAHRIPSLSQGVVCTHGPAHFSSVGYLQVHFSLLFSVIKFLCHLHIFVCLSWFPQHQILSRACVCLLVLLIYCLGDLEQHNLESPGASLRARYAYQDSIGFVSPHLQCSEASSLPPAPELASFLGILSPAFFCCSCLATSPPSKSLLSTYVTAGLQSS